MASDEPDQHYTELCTEASLSTRPEKMKGGEVALARGETLISIFADRRGAYSRGGALIQWRAFIR